MKNKTILLIAAGIWWLSANVHAQRVVGYLPSYRSSVIPSLPYNCLTDIYFSFINFNTSGNLYTTLSTGGDNSATFGFDAAVFAQVKPYCKPTSATGPNLWVSVGGADASNLRRARFSSVCANATARNTLTTELVNFAITHNLYGIDIDWEFPTSTADKNNHEQFLSELRAKINASSNPDLKICIAVGGEYKNTVNHLQYINQGAIQYCDFVNIMTYDLPASYNANHSTVNDTQLSLQAWAGANTYGISVPWSKLTLGIPYYGWNGARSGTREYMTDGSYQTAYNTGGNVGGYYYNSKADMDTKVDWIMAQGGSGVFMWDLGMDRYGGSWSYTSAICTRMASACAAPQPDLGTDAGICLPGSLTLNSNVATQSGRTFTWRRNGSLISGASGPTYNATQAGTYEVTVSQGCSRTDEIIITGASPVAADGDDRCGSGSVTLNVTSSGGTYEWYDQSTGGTLLHTGQNYSIPSLGSTTSYFVQESSGSQTYTTAKSTIAVGAAWNELADNGSNAAQYGHKLTVSQTLTIQSVVIYTNGSARSNARVVAYSTVDGLTPVASGTISNIPTMPAGTPYTLPVNLTLVPGTYYIGLYIPGVSSGNAAIWLESNYASSTAFTVAGVSSIEAKCYANYGGGFNAAQTPTHYGQLFNWTIVTGTPPPCPRTEVVATIRNCQPPNVAITNPSGSVNHDVNTALSITSSATDPDGGTITGVVYKVRNGSTVVATINGGAAPDYSGSWTPTSTGTYTITAEATDNDAMTGISSSVTVTVMDPLPVALLYFKASKHKEAIFFEWATETEKNNDYFQVLKSYDGINFHPIGRIKGSGSSIERKVYTFSDLSNDCSNCYYQLQQVDFDGTETFSEVIHLDLSEQFVSVFPNPFEGSFTLNILSDEKAEVRIYDFTGALMYEAKHQGSVSLGKDLNPGVYFVRVVCGEQNKMEKIIKR